MRIASAKITLGIAITGIVGGAFLPIAQGSSSTRGDECGTLKAVSPAVDSGEAKHSRWSRGSMLRDLIGKQLMEARRSLQEGSSEQVFNVTVSFLESIDLQDALELASDATLRPTSVAHGFRGESNYFTGEIALSKIDDLSIQGIRDDFARLLKDLENQTLNLSEAYDETSSQGRAALVLLADVKIRIKAFQVHGIPVIGLRGRGTLASARDIVNSHPHFSVAVTNTACGAAPVIPPVAGRHVFPDR